SNAHAVADQENHVLRVPQLTGRGLCVHERRNGAQVKILENGRVCAGLERIARDRRLRGSYRQRLTARNPFSNGDHVRPGAAQSRRAGSSGRRGGNRPKAGDPEVSAAVGPVADVRGGRVDDSDRCDVLAVERDRQAGDRGCGIARRGLDAEVEALVLEKLGFVGGRDPDRNAVCMEGSRGAGQATEEDGDSGNQSTIVHLSTFRSRNSKESVLTLWPRRKNRSLAKCESR